MLNSLQSMDCSLLCLSFMVPPDHNTGTGSQFPSPGDLPNLGIEPRSPTSQADSLLSEPPTWYKNNSDLTYSCCFVPFEENNLILNQLENSETLFFMETLYLTVKLPKVHLAWSFSLQIHKLHCLYYGRNKWFVEMTDDSFLVNVGNKLQYIYNFEVS